MNNYYIKFIPEAEVNYLHLFALYNLATYNKETNTFDTINYISIPKLAEKLPFSISTLNRILSNKEYHQFLNIDKANKIIQINNNFSKDCGNKCFVRLIKHEIDFLIREKDNLLCKYYLYMKYYCSLANKYSFAQNFTTNQFLLAIGYSIKSTSQIDKISSYNQKLKKCGLITITSYKDELGHTRNIYNTIY